MRNLLIRRILIITGLLSIMVAVSLSYGQSLLLTTPEDIDIIQAILAKREQQAELEAQIQAELDRIAEEEAEAQRLLEEQLQAELDRLQAEYDALVDAYTLRDRDKPQDYITLFDNGVEHTFIIDFTQAEFDGLVQDMQDYHDLYNTYRSNNYRKVNVTYITDDETIFIQDVGIRSKGNIYSRYLPIDGGGNVIPIHYVLKFNETFDTIEGTDEYDFLKTREVFDVEKLIFKWNRNYDPTYLSEVYSMQLFRQVGVAAPQMSLSKFIIRIDGVVQREDLYGVQEYIDEEFIRKNLQAIPTQEVGDLYKAIWPGTLEPITDLSNIGIRDWETNYRPTYGLETNTDVPNYAQLIDFTYDLANANTIERKAFIDNYVNVDSLLRALAVSVYLGNPDDYRGNANNYYIYFNEDGVFTYIPFDFDHSLGQGWDGSPVFINYSLGNDIYIWEGNGFSSYTDNIPLVDNILLEYDEYKIQYENYLEMFISAGYFSYDSFSDLYDTAYGLYGDEFWMSNNKEYYIDTKIAKVLSDVTYYRNLRN